jgi:AcrR family transcriptional regulator
MPRGREDTRARILAATARLVYVDGMAHLKMDAVARETGVTKQTLYDHFRNRDDLIAASLDARLATVLGLYRTWGAAGDPARPMRERLHALLAAIADYASAPGWSGCGFQRAAAELAPLPGHPGRMAPSRAKHAIEAWLAGELAAEGWPDAAGRARRIAVTIEGALVLLLVHRTADHIGAAGDMIDLILPQTAAPTLVPCADLATVW